MKQHKLNDNQIDLIINAAYNDVSIIERITAFLLIRKNNEAKRIYSEYKKTAQSVKGVQVYVMPSELEDKVKSKIGVKQENNHSFLTDLYSLIVMKPVVSGLTAVLLIATITTSIFLNQHKQFDNNNYTERDVEQAEVQTKQALEMVSAILSNTSKRVKKDILQKTVSSEINKGIEVVNQLFIEGEKK